MHSAQFPSPNHHEFTEGVALCHLFLHLQRGSAEDIVTSATQDRLADSSGWVCLRCQNFSLRPKASLAVCRRSEHIGMLGMSPLDGEL